MSKTDTLAYREKRSAIPSGTTLAAERLSVRGARADAVLIALADTAFEADRIAFASMGATAYFHEVTADNQDAADPLSHVYEEAAGLLVNIQAKTVAGLRAKARLLMEFLPKDAEGALIDGAPDWRERITLSLLRDILGAVPR